MPPPAGLPSRELLPLVQVAEVDSVPYTGVSDERQRQF